MDRVPLGFLPTLYIYSILCSGEWGPASHPLHTPFYEAHRGVWQITGQLQKIRTFTDSQFKTLSLLPLYKVGEHRVCTPLKAGSQHKLATLNPTFQIRKSVSVKAHQQTCRIWDPGIKPHKHSLTSWKCDTPGYGVTVVLSRSFCYSGLHRPFYVKISCALNTVHNPVSHYPPLLSPSPISSLGPRTVPFSFDVVCTQKVYVSR